jgi:hypothetical protein
VDDVEERKKTKQETCMNRAASKALLRADFLIDIFDPEDGDDKFLRNVGCLPTDGTDSGLDSRQKKRILLFSMTSRPAPGPTQLPIEQVPVAASPEIKLPGREADY